MTDAATSRPSLGVNNRRNPAEIYSQDGPAAGLTVGPDGLARCAWAGSAPEYVAYHDEEWGVPVHGETPLYERITLEAFQSGLAWITILRKRPAFRSAFAEFDPERVAAFDEHDRARLLADAGIVRNVRKVDAAITNARAVLELRAEGGLDAYIWSFAPDTHTPPATPADLRATSPESTALAAGLRRHGFVFVGPTTAYAAMQACGLVDDHLAGCHCAGRPVVREAAAPVAPKAPEAR
jgi:DNA-3-methyladenine glycosylase I